MESDGKVTEPVCLVLGIYLDRSYLYKIPSSCPLPDEEKKEVPLDGSYYSMGEDGGFHKDSKTQLPALERVSYILKAKKMA